MLQKLPRIAVFSLAYAPYEAGAEVACREIMGRISSFGFTVFTHRFDSAWPEQEILGNVEMVRVSSNIKNQISPPKADLRQRRMGLGRTPLAGKIKNTDQKRKNYYGNYFAKFSYVLRAWRAAEAAHRAEPFHAIWAIMASYGGASALLFKLRHPAVPLLLTLQEGDSESHILRRVGIFYPFWKMLFRKADAVTAISSYLADFAKRHGAACPITVVPNGVNVLNLKSQILNRKSDTRTIITTSRLVPKNGIDVLIRAFAQLINQQPTTHNLQLLIVGDGPARPNLERLAQELGITNRVEFSGQAPYEEIPRHLAGADIFVRPSRSEGLGSSFLEAMAAGLPVIGTPVGGIPDFLKDRETGLFAAVDDPDDLTQKIKMLIADSKLRKRIAANGAALVRERYEWDRIAGEVGAIFQSLATHYPLPVTRILVATGLFPPDVGGPATYSKLLAEQLPERGFPTDVFPFSAVRHLPPLVRHGAYALKLLRAGRRAGIIFAQDPVSVGLPAAIVAGFLRKPFLLKVVGDYAWEQGVQRFGVKDLLDEFVDKNKNRKYGWKVKLLKGIERFVAKRAEKIIVPSQYLKKVVAAWGVPENKIVVVYNAIALPESLRHWASRTGVSEKEKLGLKGRTVLLSAGRLVPWKGFAMLIEIMPDLLKKFSNLQLVIIGDGPERKILEDKVNNLRLAESVRFTGSLLHAEVMEYLVASDIFVLNTGYEGFSHQILEAMVVGKPIITTGVGGNPELVDGKSAFIIGFNDAGRFKDKIAYILNSGLTVQIDGQKHLMFGGEVKEYIEKARKNAQMRSQEFSLNRMIDDTVRILESVS